MQEIRHIVVPVDFNVHSDRLAEFALYMAKKLDAKVTFIHVMKHLLDYSDYVSSTHGSVEQLENNFLAHAKDKMTAFLENLKSNDQDYRGEVLSGEISDAIITYAKDNAADLIIISTHGAKGIEKVLLGSVADRVIKGAYCPTVVFNPFKGERGYEICAGSPMNTCIQPV